MNSVSHDPCERGRTMSDAKDRERDKKQLLLRLSPTLWQEIANWAEDDFRSINGQIEYLLTDCVRRRSRQAPTA